MNKKAMVKEEEEWIVKDDLRTLKSALEIVRDEKRMTKVREFAKKERKDLEVIEDEEYLGSIGLTKK
ncbi:hypothetical protein [Hydrogenimonas sp.]